MKSFSRLDKSTNNVSSIFIFRGLAVYFFSLLLGALLALAFYPTAIFPFCISLGVFALVLRNQNINAKIFIHGIFFGYGYFLINLYWIPLSIYKAPLNLDWLVPILSSIIPLPFALLTGLFALLTKIGRRNSVIFSINFAFLWVIFEYIRSNIFFPFSWGLLGYSSTSFAWFSQALSLFGAYGVSFLIALLATSMFSKNKKYIALNLIVFVIICAWGGIRIAKNTTSPDIDKINVRLVQPNIQDHHFGDSQKQIAALETLARLTLSSDFDQQNYVFWPEASFPYPIHENSSWLDIMKGLVPQNKNSALVFGADRIESKDNKLSNFNSILAINNDGEVMSSYDKRILVPFGEYVPYRNKISLMEKIAYSIEMGDISIGQKNNLMDLENNTKFLPIICSESMVDRDHLELLGFDDYRFILNITNDSWFGNSFGPYQHFNISIVRAIEYGLPVLRVANTGVSGVIDSFGRIIRISQLNTESVIDSTIPPKLANSTLFYEIHNLVVPMIFVLYGVFLLYLYVSRKRL
jgi:apolipoprotein N-acyltransferase